TIILVILIADFVLEKSLDILNLKYAQKGLPKSLSGIYDEAEYNRSISYQRTNLKFGMISSTINLILTLVVLSVGLLGWLNDWLNQFIGNPLMLSLVFFGVIFIGSD